MRNVILSAAFLLTAGSAMAESSIQAIDSKTSNNAGSVISRTCSDCQPHKEEIAKTQYKVPELKAGTQSIVIRQMNGEEKVVRTEAWMGGSPVVFISKATPETLAAANVPADGLDLNATTGALTNDNKAPAAAPSPLDTSSFELRTK